MNELAFRGEVMARGVTKIKNKVYHKMIARGKKKRAGTNGENGRRDAPRGGPRKGNKWQECG
ncbi:hypothetical protein B0H12DRAFT_1122961 [Mycena haematopus]|nr:hypothetical protein B0H12DRAFT_1122961 [Mycena haematopus]